MTMRMIVLAAMIAGAAFVAQAMLDDSAMAACQIKHSFDTCFYTLNR